MAAPALLPGVPQSGYPIVEAALSAGARAAFTLSGAHIFPVYDAALHSEPALRLVDVRHEASAVFAAEAVGKLTRVPGFAVVTAGPGVTNALSPITQAHFSGAPLVVLGGRAAQLTWGRGSLQELDQPPLFATVTKAAWTITSREQAGADAARAFALAGAAHRGPVFVDIPLDVVFAPHGQQSAWQAGPTDRSPDPEALAGIAGALSSAQRPVLVLGSDVWADGAESAALALATELGIPVVTNGMGRGVVPRGHPLLVTRARRAAFGRCDLAIVAGAPLDFRLGFGAFGPSGTAPVVHLADSAEQVCRHKPLAGSAYGSLGAILDGLRELARPGDWAPWAEQLRQESAAVASGEAQLLAADGDPIHPARVYGELLPLLTDD